MNVFSIFRSFDGEVNAFDGIGQPSVFVRFAGCNLLCAYCDTTYARKKTAPHTVLDPDELMEKIRMFGCRKVTLTGGEPLLQDHMELRVLFDLLRRGEIQTTVETNGSLGLLLSERDITWIRYVMDYKLPSSGMEKNMISQMLPCYGLDPDLDFVKFIVGTPEDIERAFTIIRLNPQYKFAVSPLWGSMGVNELKRRVLSEEASMKGNTHGIHLSVQMHKLCDWKEESNGKES